MKHTKKGFTLIELLIVVVIIGILAAIAIPKFAATKEKAYLATMKTDLKNLSTAEEGYASSNAGAYIIPTDTASLHYAPSAGVTIVGSVSTTAPGGWAATASQLSTTKKCGIFVGNGTPPAITGVTLQEGVPGCEP